MHLVPRLAEAFFLFCLCLLAPLAVLPDTAWLIPAPLRLFAALSLIAFLPGYLLALVLFAAHPSLSIYWLVTLSLSASFSLLILNGLLLNLLKLPVTGLALIASQSAWALVFLLLIFLPPERVPPQAFLSHRLLNAWGSSSLQLRIAYIICASLALLFAGTLNYALFAPSRETFSELYFTDSRELIHYSTSSTHNISITAVNHENAIQQYRLAVSNGSYAAQIPLLLSPGEVRTEQITLSLDASPAPKLLKAALYLPGYPDPYRQVHVWLYQESLALPR